MITKDTSLHTITALVLFFCFQVALAAVPATMNYQAYLTDDLGVPIDGTADVVISIYNVDVGGTALWSETRLGTTVNKGVLSVELGSIVPFYPGLFQTPLWIGVKVDADLEMTPRRPITSTGFAFKAGDADTIDGISASSLDQSAHVADMANPHNVTTAQIGAISGTELTAHASDSAAHHVKTSSFPELSGQISDVQIPALIARDPEIVPTILANDGPGSTLNADLLDGLSSSAFMSSATDLWVNTAGDTMTGDLSTKASIGISTYGTAPQYSLDVRRGVDSYLGYFYNDNDAGDYTYGIYTFADGRDTGTGSAYGTRNFAWGGSSSGNAYGTQNIATASSTAYGSHNTAEANGSSNAYAVYADATPGTTTGNEYAFYGLGKGYFSDNLGIGAVYAPDYKLHVRGETSTYLGYFNNDNNSSGSNTYGIQIRADGSGTVTGHAYGANNYARGGSTSGTAYGSYNTAVANGSSNAYAVYADATYGTTTGDRYALYGLGEGYFSEDLVVDGTVKMGYERITGSAVALTSAAACSIVNSGTCYYSSTTVSCPTGKTVMGGGCNCSASFNCYIADSYMSTNTSYFCRAVGSLSSYTVTPYVTCARAGS